MKKYFKILTILEDSMNAVSKLIIQFYLAVTGLVLYTSRSASKGKTEKKLALLQFLEKISYV